MKSLSKLFGRLASPFFNGTIVDSEVTGTPRNRINVSLDNGQVINCNRYAQPTEDCDMEGYARGWVENPTMKGIAFPLKDEKGAQRLIFALY